MVYVRRLVMVCAALSLLLASVGCTQARQQRYREHLGASIQPIARADGVQFAAVDTDNP